jgi:hypothetical protein
MYIPFEVAAYESIFEIFNKLLVESVSMYQTDVQKIKEEMKKTTFLTLTRMVLYYRFVK